MAPKYQDSPKVTEMNNMHEKKMTGDIEILVEKVNSKSMK